MDKLVGLIQIILYKLSIDNYVLLLLSISGMVLVKGALDYMKNMNSYIASKEEVEHFLEELKYVLKNENCTLHILPKKREETPDDPYTTANTMLDLDYDTEDVKQELLKLNSQEYIETIKDNKGTDRPPFCVSFHYARYKLKDCPYKDSLE